MVDALRETHRVLKPRGLLIDLRPAALHRRVGLAEKNSYRFRWVMRERFEDDHAADRAVAEIVRKGWFKETGLKRVPCYRVMDTLDDFREWLTDFISRGKCPPHDWLVRSVEHSLATSDVKASIVVSAPLALRTLRKTRSGRLV